MTRSALLVAALSLLTIPLAQAGSTPAGPAAGGATMSGAATNPGSKSVFRSGDESGEISFVAFGTVTVPTAQAASIAQNLMKLPGAMANASLTLVQVQVTLENGQPAVVTIDTATGELTVAKVS